MLKCLPETDRHGPWIVDTILSPYHPHTIPMLKFHSLVYRQLQAGFKPPGLRESKLHHYHCFTRWFSMIFRLASAWFYKFCQCFAIYRSICAIWCFAVFCPPQSPVGFHYEFGDVWEWSIPPNGYFAGENDDNRMDLGVFCFQSNISKPTDRHAAVLRCFRKFPSGMLDLEFQRSICFSLFTLWLFNIAMENGPFTY